MAKFQNVDYFENLGVLAMYNDMSEVPTFFFFLPLWAFLFGYYAVTKDYMLEAEKAKETPTQVPVAVEVAPPSSTVIRNLTY